MIVDGIRFALITLQRLNRIERILMRTIESKSRKSYLHVLGLAPDATQEMIRKAYRRLALQYHPDRKPKDPQLFFKLRKAYEALMEDHSNPEKNELFEIEGPRLQLGSSEESEAKRLIILIWHLLANTSFSLLYQGGFISNYVLPVESVYVLLFSLAPSLSMQTQHSGNSIPRPLQIQYTYLNSRTFLYNEELQTLPPNRVLELDRYVFDIEELSHYAEDDFTKIFTNPHIRVGNREFSEAAKNILRRHPVLGIYAQRLDELFLKQKSEIKAVTIAVIVKMLLNFEKYGVDGSVEAREEFCAHLHKELDAAERTHLLTYVIKVKSRFGGTQNLTFEKALNSGCIKIAQTFLWQFVTDIKPELFKLIPASVIYMALTSQQLIITTSENRLDEQQEARRALGDFREEVDQTERRVQALMNRLNNIASDRPILFGRLSFIAEVLLAPNRANAEDENGLEEADMGEDGIWIFRL